MVRTGQHGGIPLSASSRRRLQGGVVTGARAGAVSSGKGAVELPTRMESMCESCTSQSLITAGVKGSPK